MTRMGESDDVVGLYQCLVCINDVPRERSSLPEHLQTHRLTVPQYEEMLQGAIARQIVKHAGPQKSEVGLDSQVGGNFTSCLRNRNIHLRTTLI